jgi:serine/threonine-protein kinase
MIVKCEKCRVAFNVNDNLIKPEGTKLRCSKCKHIFTVHPPQKPVIQEEPARKPVTQQEPARKPVARQDAPAPKPPVRQEVPKREREESSSSSAGGEVTLTIVDFAQEVFDNLLGISERYVEMGTIGKGGMGEVLLARDTQLLRKVAVKVLRKEAVTPAALSFFIREAQITAQLDHPNIVPLYTVRPPAEGEKNVSFVMKLIKGKTLHEIINKARAVYAENPKAVLKPEIDLRARVEHLLKACDGITYAHRKQVVHRDLKPANIMVGDFGEVYVMDWGIAKMLKDEDQDDLSTQYTEIFTGSVSKSDGSEIVGLQPEGVLGTLSYMSPEQAAPRPDVGTASDIFSLGAILYELVTLKPPRIGDAKQKLNWAKKGFLNEISHLVPDQKVEPELRAIIQRATEFDPRDRYPSVAAFSDDIRCYLRGDEVSELPDNLPRKVIRWIGKHRQFTLILFLGVLLISATLTIGSLIQKQNAMKAAAIRENRLSQLQAEVSSQAHQIDSHFLRLEDLAIGLVNSAMYLIEDAPPNSERFYWIEEFQNPAKAPPDLAYAALYQRPVSIDYPVVKTSPNVRKEDVTPLMQRLAPLRHHFRKTLLDSRPGFAPISDEEAFRLLTVHGLPISWAYIGLEVGVMYSYPGKGSYAPEYDPRVRPWYKLGAYKSGVHWGNPYLDIQGLGMVLPCAVSLYDKKNQFYGVLGMDVTFSDIIQDNLTREGAVGVVESYLLDDKGNIVVRSRPEPEPEKQPGDASLQLKPFPVEQVVQAILRNESGLVEVEENEKSRIIAFYRMRSLKWYYVEKTDTEVILKSRNREHEPESQSQKNELKSRSQEPEQPKDDGK